MNTLDQRKELLLEMLTYKRPHGSDSEAAFIARYINPVQELAHVESFTKDEVGNIYVQVSGSTDILFTAHTDTMHRTIGMQDVWVDDSGVAFIESTGEVLGADDGAGVFLLLEMIKAGVPATYQFTVGEERGGIGSRFALEDRPEWLAQFNYAIAFDRKHNHSVITHQMNGRCCSDRFGLAFAELLGMEHKLDPTGSFTDTANYTGIIPECTNISAGYTDEHSSREALDTHYVLELATKLCSIDWLNANLPVERDPTVDDYDDYDYDYRGFGLGSGYKYDDKYANFSPLNPMQVPTYDDLISATSDEIADWMYQNEIETSVMMIQDLLQEMIELKQEMKTTQKLGQNEYEYEHEYGGYNFAEYND